MAANLRHHFMRQCTIILSRHIQSLDQPIVLARYREIFRKTRHCCWLSLHHVSTTAERLKSLCQKKGELQPPFFLIVIKSAVAAGTAAAAKKPFPDGSKCLALDLFSFFKRFHVVSPLNRGLLDQQTIIMEY